MRWFFFLLLALGSGFSPLATAQESTQQDLQQNLRRAQERQGHALGEMAFGTCFLMRAPVDAVRTAASCVTSHNKRQSTSARILLFPITAIGGMIMGSGVGLAEAAFGVYHLAKGSQALLKARREVVSLHRNNEGPTQN